VQRPGDCDVEAIRMAVEPGTFSGVMRQHVRRFEAEAFSDLHVIPGFAFDGANPRRAASRNAVASSAARICRRRKASCAC